jgi:ferredoxin
MSKSQRVDPNLMNEIKSFGVGDWNACFHCGNCTASCPLTEQYSLFPRKAIRTMQMGLKDKLVSNVEPWLCYYCGDCTKTCPRDANPGEIMMALRRYLTSLYDWTGLSKKFYTSKIWEIMAIAIIALVVVLLFAFMAPPLDTTLTPEGGVKINSFAPIKWIELGDWTMAAIVAFLLLSNIFRMYWKVIIKDKSVKIPIYLYIKEFWLLIVHFGSQWRFSKCDDKKYWGIHWLLMSGYTIMFTLIVVFLPWFQTEKIHPITHPQRFLGYYATFGLLFGIIVAAIGRFKKKDTKFKFSHASDWLFLIMLFLTTLTGILVHFFRIGGMPYATYYMYIIHLAVLVPMIMIEVPFSKWSHLAYRPFAIYFANLKKSALELQRQQQGKPAAAAVY